MKSKQKQRVSVTSHVRNGRPVQAYQQGRDAAAGPDYGDKVAMGITGAAVAGGAWGVLYAKGLSALAAVAVIAVLIGGILALRNEAVRHGAVTIGKKAVAALTTTTAQAAEAEPAPVPLGQSRARAHEAKASFTVKGKTYVKCATSSDVPVTMRRDADGLRKGSGACLDRDAVKRSGISRRTFKRARPWSKLPKLGKAGKS